MRVERVPFPAEISRKNQPNPTSKEPVKLAVVV
jgi:hypothetical protein